MTTGVKASLDMVNAQANYTRSSVLNCNTASAGTGMFIYLYASGGTPPAVDAAVTGTLIAKISNNATTTGLTCQAAAAGVLLPTNAEVWKGTVLANGIPDYFRCCSYQDNPASTSTGSGTNYRLQGTVGANGCDMNLAALINGGSLTAGASVTIDPTFAYAMPQQ